MGIGFQGKHSLAVSFEAIAQDVEVYEPIRIANEIVIETLEISLEVDDAVLQ